MINQLAVLNTVTAGGTDVNLSTDGNCYIKNLANSFPNMGIKSVKITTPVAAVAGARTITPVAANSSQYKLIITTNDTVTGALKTVILDYTTAASGDTATTICDAWREQLAEYSNIPLTGSGTTTFIVTGSTDFPEFTVAAPVGNISGHTTYSTSPVIGVGLASKLAEQYPAALTNSLSGWEQIADLTSGYYYTQVEIYAETSGNFGGGYNDAVTQISSVILVKFGTDPSVASTTTNYYDLLDSTYGVFYGLQKGYKYTITTETTTTAAVTITTGAIALAGGSVTLASLGAQSGDILVIQTSASFATYGTTTITGITGAAAGFGTTVTAISADDFKHVAVRNIPR